MNALVVEDDPTLADGLRRRGYDVVVVETGAAALQADGIDVVLLDLGRPDIDRHDVATSCDQVTRESGNGAALVTRVDDCDLDAGLVAPESQRRGCDGRKLNRWIVDDDRTTWSARRAADRTCP